MAQPDPDQPDPADIASLHWQRIHTKIRNAIEKRVDSGELQQLIPAELAIFLDCCERAYGGDLAALSFDTALNTMRDGGDDLYQGAYRND